MTAHLFNFKCKQSVGELVNLLPKDYGVMGEVSKPVSREQSPAQTKEMRDAGDPILKELMEAKERIRQLEDIIRKQNDISPME